MENLNANTIWVKVKDVAELINTSIRSIQRYCKSDKYVYRMVNGNGGMQYEILLSSLEPEVQTKIMHQMIINSDEQPTQKVQDFDITKVFRVDELNKDLQLTKTNLPGAEHYIHKHADTANSAPFSLTVTQNSSKELSLVQNKFSIKTEEFEMIKDFGLLPKDNSNYIIPDKAKNKALAKVDLINVWQIFRQSADKKSSADNDFINLYNKNFIHKDLFKTLGKVSIKTLYNWNKIYIENNFDWKSLIDNYCYGCESQLISDLTNIEKVYLLKYMLHQNKFKLSKAYEYIKNDLACKGIQVKNIKSYRHVWNYIVKNHGDLIAFARGGQKVALDEQLPHITKDSSRLNFGDVITGDGHTLDFMVIDPQSGKPARATLVAFQDDASRDIVGYDIMTSENTQVIASALRHAILYMGKIPKVVHLDNGRAFKSKTFVGCDMQNSSIKGIYTQLGIRTIFSKPYNGRAKQIERFFKEFTESCAKIVPSYIGNNIENKPASCHRNEKFHKDLQGNFVPTIEETKIIIDKWLNEIYRKRPCNNDKSKTIAQYVSEGKGEGIEVSKLDELMLVSEERQIKKGAIRLFKTYYYADKLVGLNQKVIAKYDMFDLSYVKVFSLKGEYLCIAKRNVPVHPYAEILGTPKDIIEYKQQVKATDRVKKERMSIIKRSLKTLYPGNKVIEAKKFEQQQELKQIKHYKIDYAENQNILDFEQEKHYTIDAEKLI